MLEFSLISKKTGMSSGKLLDPLKVDVLVREVRSLKENRSLILTRLDITIGIPTGPIACLRLASIKDEIERVSTYVKCRSGSHRGISTARSEPFVHSEQIHNSKSCCPHEICSHAWSLVASRTTQHMAIL